MDDWNKYTGWLIKWVSYIISVLNMYDEELIKWSRGIDIKGTIHQVVSISGENVFFYHWYNFHWGKNCESKWLFFHSADVKSLCFLRFRPYSIMEDELLKALNTSATVLGFFGYFRFFNRRRFRSIFLYLNFDPPNSRL